MDRVDEFPDEFKCCVCMNILYKPVVLACGHSFCLLCTFENMNIPQSHCRVCHNPYIHFPRTCELLHFLLLKLYPSAYKRRAAQVAEDKKDYGFESPQFESNFVVSKSREGDHAQDARSSRNTSIQLTSSHEAPSNDANAMETSTTKVLVTDLECNVCKQLLYRPIVLNCGHVYCESCIHPDKSMYKCLLCKITHSKEIPNVCLFLHHFLKGYFPKEYSSRKEECLAQSEGPCGTRSWTEKKDQTVKSSSPPGPFAHRANFHYGVGCDYCGMYPIIGQRYRCKDCVEKIGFAFVRLAIKVPPSFRVDSTSNILRSTSLKLYNLLSHEWCC